MMMIIDKTIAITARPLPDKGTLLFLISIRDVMPRMNAIKTQPNGTTRRITSSQLGNSKFSNIAHNINNRTTSKNGIASNIIDAIASFDIFGFWFWSLFVSSIVFSPSIYVILRRSRRISNLREQEILHFIPFRMTYMIIPHLP